MKKIVCPYCSHFIKTDSEDSFIECPNCSKHIVIEQGERVYNMLVMKYFNNAHVELYAATNYKKAALFYQKVLDLEPKEIDAVYGLSLSLLFCSTVHVTHLVDSLNILKKYEATIKEDTSPERRLEFVERIGKSLFLYVDTISSRLSIDNSFDNETDLSLYKTACEEAITYLTHVTSIFFDDDFDYPKKSKLTKKSLLEQIDELTKKSRKVVIRSTSERLDETKEASINEVIFKDNQKLYKARNIFLILLASFIVVFAIGLILIFAIKSNMLIGAIIASISLVCAIISFVGNIVLKRKLFK